MKLNEKQKKKLLQNLESKWKNKVCEICSETNWAIDDTLFELREFHGGKTLLGSGAIKPVITMACDNCGNTKLMNAIQLGLVDPNNPSGELKKGGDDD